MKFKNKFALLASLSLIALPALAGSQTGKIAQLYIRASDGLVYFNLSGPVSGRPACASNSYWMIKDENSAAGKRQTALLLTARATDQVITVYGSSTCTRWGDGEDVDLIAY
jgi:hypothetical protein